MSEEEIVKLTNDLAAIEHERWSSWQRYVHSQCRRCINGDLVIPAELARGWERQMNTPYPALTEEEKESDREQVRKYLPRLLGALPRL